MYITDARHFLDTKGAIGPKRGPARTLAEFLGGVITAATLPSPSASCPGCIQCAGAVSARARESGGDPLALFRLRCIRADRPLARDAVGHERA
ncbi:MAG: hypothetical protein IPG63_17900 [Xanthomonadales bacterium]|nr:hypothetical protein [Xanthomonadales bacterium]MCC6561432.1 hypothetical protein [Xanthomonadales bacterium]